MRSRSISRTLDEAGVTPLFDALDHARTAHIEGVRGSSAPPVVKAAALRRVAAAYQRLSAGIASLVVESAAPAAEQLREVVRETARLRAEVSGNEARIAELERQFATVVDPSAPADMATSPGSATVRDDRKPSLPPGSRRRTPKETLR
jgi:hypothetical protein